MGFSYRLHLHTEVGPEMPVEALAWLRGEGDAAAMLAVLPDDELTGYLAELTEWRPPLDVTVEELRRPTFRNPTAHPFGHRIVLSGLIHDDSVLLTFGLAALLAPYAEEGMLGVSWPDMHQETNPTLFLVQDGRLYVAGRYTPPGHVPRDGGDPVPWRPFKHGDPEADRCPT